MSTSVSSVWARSLAEEGSESMRATREVVSEGVTL
jgi:head-tail adaptor